MRVEKITPVAERGKGWARAPFKDCEAPSVLASMAIKRPSHMAPYLGRMGWQISESRLPLSLEVTGDSEFALLLPPAVVQHLEVGNYEFLFFDQSARLLQSVIVRWAGVTYRAPRGEISPIEIIEPDAPPPNQPIISTAGKESDFPKPVEPEGFSSGPAVTGFGTSWTGTPEPAAPLPTSSPTPPPPPPPPRPAPTGTYDRREVRRIRCMNTACGAEILDSMTKCPFCSKSR
jgi:hypothetical protein